MVLEGWIVFHLFFVVGGFGVFFAVSHYRLFKSLFLDVFILLLLV